MGQKINLESSSISMSVQSVYCNCINSLPITSQVQHLKGHSFGICLLFLPTILFPLVSFVNLLEIFL